MNKDFFIGRQSILDKHENIFAYEMLYRSSDMGSAFVNDNLEATSQVMLNIMQNFGLDKLLGDKKGFINIDESVINEGVIELIPKDKFVLEILETSKIDESTINKIINLKAEGYIFALDDFVLTKEYLSNFQQLVKFVDYIKVDYMDTDKSLLNKYMSFLKSVPAKLLAEKVENREEFEACVDLGFDYFQGYYFAKPNVVKKSNVEPGKTAIVRLVSMIRQDCDVAEIEKVLKQFPELNINLLKFINSSAFFLKTTVSSIRHAISLIGRANLTKWLSLLLYAGVNNPVFDNNPLMQTVVSRAKTMEMLAAKSCKSKDSQKTIERAYLCGLMSLMDVVFNKPLDEFINDFNLDSEITDAILYKGGTLGKLLKVIIKLETYDLSGLDAQLDELGLDFETLKECRLNSLSLEHGV